MLFARGRKGFPEKLRFGLALDDGVRVHQGADGGYSSRGDCMATGTEVGRNSVLKPEGNPVKATEWGVRGRCQKIRPESKLGTKL